MNEKQEAVLEKVRKLLSLAQSSNQAEAEAAALKAQELLISYNLSLDDIPRAEIGDLLDETTVEEGRYLKKWRQILLSGICETSFCGLMTCKGYRGAYRFVVIGRESCIAQVKVLYDYLEAAIERIGSRECRGMSMRKREQFRVGMVVTISARLRAQYDSQVEGRGQTALVLYDPQEIQRRFSLHGCVIRPLGLGRRDTNAFKAGCAAGQEVSLSRQVRGAGSAADRQLAEPALASAGGRA